jgi:tetratricopeptide (TPR) repeat protein
MHEEDDARPRRCLVGFVRFAGFVGFVCFVGFVLPACSRPSRDTPDAEPTFTRDVAPIVYKECATCHRPGEAAPFPLLTYADLKGRARQIAEVTESRFMPPWMPEPGHGAFVGERRLTDAQIATLQRWVERGAPEGDAGDLPAMPEWPAGWQLGTPDLTISMPAPVTAPADGPDLFRTVILPLPTDRVRYVRAVEFRPGNPRAVHHAMVRLVRDPQTTAGDPGSGSRTAAGGMRIVESTSMLAEGDIASPDGHVIGWAPGYSPTEAPRGMAWRLEPGTSAAIELHLQPTGKPEDVQASVGLFFTDEAPLHAPFGLQLGSYTIDIPPGDASYVVEDRYELPVDVELHAIYPHAHYLGKDIRAFATLPDGTEHSLIWIKDWDFNWQNAYRYRTPLRLPRGTIVRMRYTYDNSAANPRNPSSPPVRVRYGGQSSNEMGNLWMQVVAAPSDLARLREDYAQKSAQRQIAGYEQLAAEQPESAGVRRALGAAYLRVGRMADALKVLEASVRLEPGDATAHYNLAHAFAAAKRPADALRHFREAARLAPSFAEAHNNAGALLRQAGQALEAERAFRAAIAAAPEYAAAHNNLGAVRRARGDARGAIAALQDAVRLDPGFADAHFNLALAYQDVGDRPAATRHLRRVIELQPGNAQALNALAWLFATAPDATPTTVAESVRLAERAADLTGGRDASALDTLAAAYAAAGDLPVAIGAAERALQVAQASGETALAAGIARRLALYKQRERKGVRHHLNDRFNGA